VNYISKDLNLLELRKSQRDELAKALAESSSNALDDLKRNIENTLSRFSTVVPENEEQIYLFGIDMHHLLKAAHVKPIALGEIRDHLNPSVRVLFVCGLLGLSLIDARAQLSNDRRKRMTEQKAVFATRLQRQKESEDSLVEDIKDMVSETAASLLPPDIIPRR
jgi:hypothetical protein